MHYELLACPVGADDLAVPEAAIDDVRVNGFAFRLGNFRTRYRPVLLARGFLAGPSEEPFGGRVAVTDTEGFVDRQDGIVDLIEQAGLKLDLLPRQIRPVRSSRAVRTPVTSPLGLVMTRE